jgi:hypothetical protein
MSFWTVILVSLVLGLLLVIGGTLVSYMGSLVKNAYTLKVEIQAEMEAGLKRAEEESDKRTKWIKRDLVEEIDKLKSAVSTDNQRKFAELADELTKKVEELEQAHKRDRQEMVRVIDALRQDVMTLDQRLKSLRRDAPPAPPSATPPAEAETAAAALPPPSETPMAEVASDPAAKPA